jgi:hypothetical protein
MRSQDYLAWFIITTIASGVTQTKKPDIVTAIPKNLSRESETLLINSPKTAVMRKITMTITAATALIFKTVAANIIAKTPHVIPTYKSYFIFSLQNFHPD